MLKPSPEFTQNLLKEIERAAHEDGVIDPYETALIESFSEIFGEQELKSIGMANHFLFLLFAGSKQTRLLLEATVGANLPAPDDFGKRDDVHYIHTYVHHILQYTYEGWVDQIIKARVVY